MQKGEGRSLRTVRKIANDLFRPMTAPTCLVCWSAKITLCVLGSMETDGAAVVSGSSQSLLADLFSASSSSTLGEDLGTSTIAIFVLFGASTFAAVGMFSKTWLLEDYRGACLFVLVYSICGAGVSMSLNTIICGVVLLLYYVPD